MKFLLKKDGSGVTEISLDELAKKFNLATLSKAIDSIKTKVEDLVKKPNVDKTYIMDNIKDEFLKKGELINLSNAASIEKMKSIPEGTVYFNKTKDALRIKTKKGWVSLITE